MPYPRYAAQNEPSASVSYDTAQDAPSGYSEPAALAYQLPAPDQHTSTEGPQAANAGWDAYDRVAGPGETSYEAKNALRLQLSNVPTLLKILDNQPFDSYHVHWFKEITTGRRSFRGRDVGCPPCDELGHRPRKVGVFNVAAYDDTTGTWENRVWETGRTVSDQLRALANDRKRGPLTNPVLYFAVSKTGAGTETKYHVETVKARDLEEDWGIQSPSQEDASRLLQGVQNEAWERHNSVAELREAVARVLAESENHSSAA
ncbi:hypothetical protein [Streptomyces sp. UNOC14_S4]|uniref:hypothetical protein n=1 Tax=Streptomyces sp. UNOC14_S4 TaxID=2872340 RepID=UPI001E2ABC37|nr:hypothetical protein [Streptomyces sp. UNOC14_S4]MCC3766024.1 hypothetical protein [Streptomyces sp. UNOC14_S4]